jgi:two-component system, chemotaxis family, chemotaxis protein CheY
MSDFRVLIVDDSPTMRQFLGLAVQRVAGVSYDQAQDGIEALKILKKSSYDIALLDINMPALNGIKLLQMLKADPQTADMRVVVISTEGAAQTREQVMALGADIFLTKPVVSKQVTEAVRTLLADR